MCLIFFLCKLKKDHPWRILKIPQESCCPSLCPSTGVQATWGRGRLWGLKEEGSHLEREESLASSVLPIYVAGRSAGTRILLFVCALHCSSEGGRKKRAIQSSKRYPQPGFPSTSSLTGKRQDIDKFNAYKCVCCPRSPSSSLPTSNGGSCRSRHPVMAPHLLRSSPATTCMTLGNSLNPSDF